MARAIEARATSSRSAAAGPPIAAPTGASPTGEGALGAHAAPRPVTNGVDTWTGPPRTKSLATAKAETRKSSETAAPGLPKR